MTAAELSTGEVRAVIEALLSREKFIQTQMVPGAPWDSSWFRSPDLQSAYDKLSEDLADGDDG